MPPGLPCSQWLLDGFHQRSVANSSLTWWVNDHDLIYRAIATLYRYKAAAAICQSSLLWENTKRTYARSTQPLYGRGCAVISHRAINCIVTCSLVARSRDNHADVWIPHRLTRLGVSLLRDRRNRDYMERGVVSTGVRLTVAASAHQRRGTALYWGCDRSDRHHQDGNSAIESIYFRDQVFNFY